MEVRYVPSLLRRAICVLVRRQCLVWLLCRNVVSRSLTYAHLAQSQCQKCADIIYFHRMLPVHGPIIIIVFWIKILSVIGLDPPDIKMGSVSESNKFKAVLPHYLNQCFQPLSGAHYPIGRSEVREGHLESYRNSLYAKRNRIVLEECWKQKNKAPIWVWRWRREERQQNKQKLELGLFSSVGPHICADLVLSTCLRWC